MKPRKPLSTDDRKNMFNMRQTGAGLKDIADHYKITPAYAGEICRNQCFLAAMNLTEELVRTTQLSDTEIADKVFATYKKLGFRNDPAGRNRGLLQHKINYARGIESSIVSARKKNHNTNPHKREIFALRMSGLTFRMIGARFHLTPARISQICHEECCRQAKQLTYELVANTSLTDAEIIYHVLAKYEKYGLDNKNLWGTTFVQKAIDLYRIELNKTGHKHTITKRK